MYKRKCEAEKKQIKEYLQWLHTNQYNVQSSQYLQCVTNLREYDVNGQGTTENMGWVNCISNLLFD